MRYYLVDTGLTHQYHWVVGEIIAPPEIAKGGWTTGTSLQVAQETYSENVMDEATLLRQPWGRDALARYRAGRDDEYEREYLEDQLESVNREFRRIIDEDGDDHAKELLESDADLFDRLQFTGRYISPKHRKAS